MDRVEEYTVCSSISPFNVAEEVNVMIQEGWQPWGEMKAISDINGPTYSQAMVKYKAKIPIKVED